jgi:hypothetical protein
VAFQERLNSMELISYKLIIYRCCQYRDYVASCDRVVNECVAACGMKSGREN